MSPIPAARGLFAVVVTAAVLGLTGALGMPAASAADEPGQVRIAHLSPDTPAVDITVAPLPPDGAPLTDPGPDLDTGLGYGDVGGFAELPAGSYAVGLRAAGSPRTAPPLLSARVEVPAVGAVTVALRGRFDALTLSTLPEDLSAPPTGWARVRVLAAAGAAPPLDVSRAGGPVLASALPFGGAGSPVPVPAGPASLRIDDGRGAVDVEADLAAGSISTLLVLDRPDGGLTLRVVLDAAAPALAPTGGVEAGGGGTPAAWSAWSAVALSLALVGRRRPLGLLTAGVVVAVLLPAPPAPRTAADAPAVELVAHAADVPSVPTRVRVPTAGVDAPLDGVGLDAAGALAVPADGATAGWYAGGTTPGAPGPAVLTGHVDGGGKPAVFARLDEVRAGDPVVVERADGTSVRFVVTRVARYPKTAFPTAAVYGPTTGPELRLITCGGAFDRSAGSYVDNVVVWAVAA